jgi:hypothetical protein
MRADEPINLVLEVRDLRPEMEGEPEHNGRLLLLLAGPSMEDETPSIGDEDSAARLGGHALK